MNRTLAGEIPCADSSALISRVPMLLTPLTPIFLPASAAMVVTRDWAVTTSARVFGARMEAWARMRNLAPAASARVYAT
jgi:hypothetical protein